MRRSERKRREPGLGILAARLLSAVQEELFTRLAERGHGQLHNPHGLVLAYLDEEGSRASELAARSGRHKQIVGRVVDDLEALGYVERCPDPRDRRAKLIAPTERGRDALRLSDQIMADIERRLAATLGATAYARFRQTLATVAEQAATARASPAVAVSEVASGESKTPSPEPPLYPP